MDYGILSVVPIIITLVLAFKLKNVFIALMSGILTSTVIIGAYTGDFIGGLESVANVFTDTANDKIACCRPADFFCAGAAALRGWHQFHRRYCSGGQTIFSQIPSAGRKTGSNF